jgi:hypothetical protein
MKLRLCAYINPYHRNNRPPWKSLRWISKAEVEARLKRIDELAGHSSCLELLKEVFDDDTCTKLITGELS